MGRKKGSMNKRISKREEPSHKIGSPVYQDLDIQVEQYDIDESTGVELEDELYYVRFLCRDETCILSEMFPVIIKSIYDDVFVGLEENSKVRFLINKKYYGDRLFQTKYEAEMKKCELEDKYKFVKMTRRLDLEEE